MLWCVRRWQALAPLALLVLSWSPVQAALLPDQIAAYKKISANPVTVAARPLWNEYGLQQTEQVIYESEGKQFTATAYRFNDTTGAFAAYQWQRVSGSRVSKLSETAAETKDGALVAYGNYLVRFEGWKPQIADLAALTDRLPKLEKSPLPVLPTYLPAENLVANSERYVLGPASLKEFGSGIPPSVAAFHMGAEGQIGAFQGKGGQMRLAIFSYPTPHIARDQLAAFAKLPGAMAKRSGPLVAVILSPPDADEAERLLASVRYEASVILSERMPTRRDNIGDLIVNIFILTGILLIFCVVAGIGYAGLRRWAWAAGDGEAMIRLHLQDR